MPTILPMRVSVLAIASLGAILIGGCATYQGPRIDPTGESLFVWPGQPAVVAAPAPPGAVATPAAAPTSPALPAAPPVAAPLPFGNVQAPPVYSDPPMPAIPPTPAAVPGAVPAPYPYAPTSAVSLPANTVTPAVPIVSAGVSPYAAVVPPGHEHLRLTPDRFVAPVGSQVLLKAGIGSGDGYLVANQRIEWSVARNGVGQLGDLGLNNAAQFYAWWEAPQKIDDWTAVGRTVYLPVTLDTLSPGPNADVRIEKGESWITLTSATEGTSLVTATAPGLEAFNQATAQVYWIDAQWIFPASVAAEAGRPHTLTTTVMRRSDGAPLSGWIVRYNVSGGASLGYAGGNSTDVPTDATGRASVEVSPSESGAGTTTVGITIIRPESVGPNALPRLELGRSAATIAWGTGVPVAAPAVGPAPTIAPQPALPIGPPPSYPAPAPMPANEPTPSTFSQPLTNQPSATSPPVSPPPYGPPANPNATAPPPNAPAGRPRLEVTLRPTGPEQVGVGEYVVYDLTIANRGDGPARHIEVRDRFDQGLKNSMDSQHTNLIRNTTLRDLAPNDQQTIQLAFQVIAPGKQCHDLTVTADGAEPFTQRNCVTGIQASLNVKVSCDRSRIVGQNVEIKVSVRNVGSNPATQIDVRIQLDKAIQPFIENGAERLPDGSLDYRLTGQLAPNEVRVLSFQGRCVSPSNKACARATVTASGGGTSQDEACVEILPEISGSTPLGPGPP